MTLAFQNDPKARYFVHFERSMFSAGMFIVVDGFTGTTCGEYQFFQENAERLRDRLNAQQRAIEQAA
jgi:hypothetical protein